MNKLPFALAGLALALSSAAMAARPLTADEHTSLRCAVGFARVAAGQQRGEAAMKQYPRMAPRGREFFVRLAAQLMDDAGLDEAGIRSAAAAESAALAREGGAAGVMPFCLQLLDAQPGLPRG